MNFIKQMIVERNLKEEFRRKEEPRYSMVLVNDYIKDIKSNIDLIANNKKEINSFDTNEFLRLLKRLEENHYSFMYDLALKQYHYKRYGYDDGNKDTGWKKAKSLRVQKEIEYMLEKKKKYRHDFERLYINFKRATKGCDFPRRNEILGLMRKAFDFDNTYHQQVEKAILIYH